MKLSYHNVNFLAILGKSIYTVYYKTSHTREIKNEIQKEDVTHFIMRNTIDRMWRWKYE